MKDFLYFYMRLLAVAAGSFILAGTSAFFLALFDGYSSFERAWTGALACGAALAVSTLLLGLLSFGFFRLSEKLFLR